MKNSIGVNCGVLPEKKKKKNLTFTSQHLPSIFGSFKIKGALKFYGTGILTSLL